MGCTWKCQCGNKSNEATLDVSQITLKILEEDDTSFAQKASTKNNHTQKINSTMQSDSKYFSSPEITENNHRADFLNLRPPSPHKEASQRLPYEQAIKYTSKFPTDFVTVWSSEDVLLEGELMRYRPGISHQFISRWCQVTYFEFMYFKNQYSAQCWFDKPLCLVPLAQIKDVKRARFKVPEKQQKLKKSNNLYQFEIFLTDEDQMTELSRHADEDPMSQVLLLKTSVNDQKQSVEDGKLMKRPVRVESPERSERSDVSKKSRGCERTKWSTREIEWYTAERRLLFSAQDEASCMLWINTIQNALSRHK